MVGATGGSCPLEASLRVGHAGDRGKACEASGPARDRAVGAIVVCPGSRDIETENSEARESAGTVKRFDDRMRMYKTIATVRLQ